MTPWHIISYIFSPFKIAENLHTVQTYWTKISNYSHEGLMRLFTRIYKALKAIKPFKQTGSRCKTKPKTYTQNNKLTYVA